MPRRWRFAAAVAAIFCAMGAAAAYHWRAKILRHAAVLMSPNPFRAVPASAAVELPPIAKYHPRILINRDLNLAELKARARTSKAGFAAVQKILDGREFRSGKSCRVGENVRLTMLMALGYMYQMTGKAEYADFAIDDFFLSCLGPHHDGSDDPAFQLEEAALLFDWTYDRIVERGLKQQIVEKIKSAYLVVASQPSFAHYVREADFHNYTVEFENAWLMAGLALYGEDPAAEEMLQRGWGSIATGYPFQPTTFGDTFQFNLKASIDMTGGAMNWEGPFYWRGSAPEIVRAIEAMDTATNRSQKLWSTVFQNLRNAGYYHIYTLRPNRTLPGLGDTNPGMKLSWKDNFALAILLDRFKDGHIRQLIDINGGGWYGGYGTGGVFGLMYYDTAVPAQKFDDLPTAQEYGREVYMRSGWGESDTYVTFTSGSLGYYHNHLDENSFTVFREADLATDGGYSLAAPYYQNYAKRTVAHNAITVFDPSECWRDTSAACTLSNDGGQRWPLRRFNPPFQKDEFGINRLWSATILKDPMYREQFATAVRKTDFQKAYDFIDSDATRAYSNEWSGKGSNTNHRVRLARREMIFVKPGWIAVLDRVESTNPAFRKAWLLHSTDAPSALKDGRWEPAEPGVKQLTGVNQMMVRNGKASMLVRVVLPEGARIQTIGGPGYEGWVNGQNYWTPTMDKVPNIGRWRFEVSPAAPSAKDLFLHVLSVARPGTAPDDAIEPLTGSPNMTGVAAGQAVDAAVMVFSRTPEPQKSYTYQAPRAALHVVADLAPGTYTVWRDEAKETTAQVSADKCLSFRAAKGGQFRITVANSAP